MRRIRSPFWPLRIMLGVVFLLAGGAKLASWRHPSVQDTQLWLWLGESDWMILVLAGAEVAFGATLLVGLAPRWSLIAVAVGITTIAIMASQGEATSCGCFGVLETGGDESGLRTAARGIVVSISLLALLVLERQRNNVSVV